MNFLLKDPQAILDYSIDWGAEYLSAGDMLTESDWSVVPAEAGGVTIAGSNFDTTISTVKASGGAPGRIYRLVNHITTGSGRIDERSIVLRVKNR